MSVHDGFADKEPSHDVQPNFRPGWQSLLCAFLQVPQVSLSDQLESGAEHGMAIALIAGELGAHWN